MTRLAPTILGVGLAAALGGILLPFYWAVVASLTPEARLFEGPSLLPLEPVLDHYRALFDERDFWVPIRNSLIVASATTALCVSLGSLCAYALARMRFRGRRALLAGVLAVAMFPQISIVSPLYLVLRALGLIDSFPGLVLPYLTFAMPLTIWLLVGFFRQLPPDLEEAAWVDGAGRLRALVEVVLPVAAPDRPSVDDEGERLDLTIRTMRRYLEAASGPAVLHEAGVRFALPPAA